MFASTVHIFRYMKKPSSLVKACLSAQTPKCLVSYMEHVGSLDYDEDPDYGVLRQLFHKELVGMKCSDKPDVLDWVLSKPKSVKVIYISLYLLIIILALASCV